MWVERLAQLAVDPERGEAYELWEEVFLRQPNTALAGDDAAEADGLVEDILERLVDAVHLAWWLSSVRKVG